ncbi:MAG TPA: TonB-dependent receptor [Cyclobacteriaceae bacterium]|nr:TonB-dependent receptor [Cyclobacteriaceae bacterium]
MRLFVLFFLLSFPLIAQAQLILTGKVTDADTGEPLPGVTIYISDFKKGSVTNDAGAYTLDGLRNGKFLVEFKLIGYTARVETVQLVDSQTELNVTLSSMATELHEVVVTGISHTTELRKNPIPLTTLNNQLLVENTSTNLIDNISKKPGISQISTGAAISKPVIRGLSYNRIITLYDGTRQEGQQWGDEHGIEIDEFSVDRVEIIKGAGSLMYGSDGIGGVINFLTPNPVASGSIVGKWISNYQTNNGLFGNSLSTAGNINGLYWLVRVSNKTSRSYTNAFDARVFNSGFRETNLNGTLGISKKWGYSEFTVSSFNQSVGLVEGDRDAEGHFTRIKNENGTEIEATATDDELNSYHLFIPNQTIQHFRVSNTSNLYLKNSRLQTNVGYQRNQRKEFGNVLDENEAELYFDLNTLNYNLIYFLAPVKAWEISAGMSGMFQQNQNKGDEFLIPEYTSFDWGAFGFAKRPLGKLDLAGGLRYDIRTINSNSLYLDPDGNPSDDPSMEMKFKEANVTFKNISASAGATYEFSKLFTGKLNVSRGFRAPNISELASNGVHEGTLRYEYGNFSLDAETSLQFDVSALLNSPHVTLEMSIFQNTIDNYIYTEKLLASNGMDSIPDLDDPAPAYQYVQGKARLRGGELTMDIHPHPLDWLHFENSFSFVAAENTSVKNDSAKYLPFIPAPRLQSELRATIKNFAGIFSNSFMKVEFNYFWQQDRVLLAYGTETPTASYALWNIGLGSAIKTKTNPELFSIYFTVTNMLDKAYQHHLSRLKYAAENPVTGRAGVFNMGRNFSFKVVVPMTFKRSTTN